MTTKVATTKTQPAITMDSMHVDSFTFKQERITNPKRVVGMSGCLYGIDGNGEKVFDKETFSVRVEDVDGTVAQAHIAAGGTLDSFTTEYIAAKQAINDAIVAGTLTDATLMAHFEAAMARIAELDGKVDISGIS